MYICLLGFSFKAFNETYKEQLQHNLLKIMADNKEKNVAAESQKEIDRIAAVR